MMVTKDRRARRVPARPTLEALEQLALLSGNVLQTNLVSDLPGVAQVTDPNLVNPWGISESNGSPFWISDNNAGVSTLYNGKAATPSTVTINPLVVSIPAPGAPLGTDGTPTGTVFNTTTSGFTVTGVNKNGAPATAKAIFLFVTEDGTIVGWNPGVNPAGFDPAKPGTYGIIAVDNSGNNFTEADPHKQTGAVYKGMAIANSPTAGTPIFATDAASTSVIYASNFRSGQIEVYDTKFNPVSLPAGAFSDPNIPNDYAPFNVQVLNNLVYVTYAKQDSLRHDDDAGPHRGFVDVFNLDGTPGGPGGSPRLVTRGALDSPWGLAIAPASFGDLAGDLLVGNFGNGRIDVYNPATGDFLGNLKDPDGEPIQIDGLWALKVGNGGNGGSANVVYFTAGLFGETHGLFGSLTSVPAGSADADAAETQMMTAFQDVFTTAVQTLNADVAAGAPRSQIVQDAHAVDVALHDLVRAEIHYLLDTQADQGGGSLKGDRDGGLVTITGDHHDD